MANQSMVQTNGDAKRPNPQMLLKAELEKVRGALAEVLPKHVTPERITKVVLSATARNASLLECTTQSIVRSVMQAAELGLEIGGLLGEAYLVPFKRSWKAADGWHSQKEAQCITGYRGLIKLARQSGQILSIGARVVHERDVFDVNLADERIQHCPTFRDDPGPLIAVYAIARFREGGQQVEVMPFSEIEKIRKRSKTYDPKSGNNDGPWSTDFEEMARKTVVRRLCKYLPLSPELARALAIDDEAESEANVIDAEVRIEKPRAKALAEQISARAGEMMIDDQPAVASTEPSNDVPNDLENVPENADDGP